MDATLYRDFEISRNPYSRPPCSVDWQFVHKDYDGPEDRRFGHGPTLDDCKEQIDEMLEDS